MLNVIQNNIISTNYSPSFFNKPVIQISNIHFNGNNTILEISSSLFVIKNKVLIHFLCYENEKYYKCGINENVYYPIFDMIKVNKDILKGSLNSLLAYEK